MITKEYIKSILNYNHLTGKFTWLVCKGQAVRIGMSAGRVNNDGYLGIGIDGEKYQAHRLAWLYMNGTLPKEQIDHINHDRLDNRIKNLREASASENQKNRIKNKNNKSGFCGVSKSSKGNAWVAQIGFNGKVIYLGSFDKIEDAILSRKSANKKYSFHKNHGE